VINGWAGGGGGGRGMKRDAVAVVCIYRVLYRYIYYTCVSMYVCIQCRIVRYNFIEILVRV